MRFRKERAIALLASHGAVALKLAEIIIDQTGHDADGRLAPSGLLFMLSGFGLWAAYRALRWASEETGDEIKFGRNETVAVTMLAVLILGVGLVAFSAGLFSGYLSPT